MEATLTAINDATGFANGDMFHSIAQVRDYFTADNMARMFGPSDESPHTTEQLDTWAAAVLMHHAHCDF